MKAHLKQILKFRDDRDWKQFHSAKNLAISLSLEANEVLELFQWTKSGNLPKEARQDLEDELADVYAFLLLLANSTGVDLNKAFKTKMKKNEAKYPIGKSKGKSTKYTKL